MIRKNKKKRIFNMSKDSIIWITLMYKWKRFELKDWSEILIWPNWLVFLQMIQTCAEIKRMNISITLKLEEYKMWCLLFFESQPWTRLENIWDWESISLWIINYIKNRENNVVDMIKHGHDQNNTKCSVMHNAFSNIKSFSENKTNDFEHDSFVYHSLLFYSSKMQFYVGCKSEKIIMFSALGNAFISFT